MPTEMNAHSPRRRRTTTSPSKCEDRGGRPSIFLHAVDCGLIGVLFTVPFLLGGRLAVGQLALVVLACWTAIAWALHQALHSRSKWIWTCAEPLLLAGAGLGLLQIVHLPAEVIAVLSPRIPEILPLWTSTSKSEVTLGQWSQLSLAPAETRSGLVIYLAYALIFVVTTQRIRQVEDVERLLRWIAYAVVAMAAFGLIQFLAGNGKFYWFYEYPFTTPEQRPKGGFTTKNHFAHFLALGVGPLIWYALKTMGGSGAKKSGFGRSRQGSQPGELANGLLFVALATVVFAGLLAVSRGGVVALFTATVVCLGVLYRDRLVSGKLFAGISGMGLLLGAFLFIYGHDQLSDRLEDWNSPARWKIWEANLAAAFDFPFVGTGIGTHREAHAMYLDLPHPREFTHAENGYLQVASETGLVGFSLAIMAMGMCLYWCLRGLHLSRNARTTTALAAVVAGLVANFLHSFVDFIWYIPGCMVVVVLLAACACRLFQLARSSPDGSHRPEPVSPATGVHWAWGASAAGVLVLGTWMGQTTWPRVMAEPHWHEYLRLSQAGNDRGEEAEEEYHEWFHQRMSALSRAADMNPHDARIQRHLATAWLERFHLVQEQSENPMTLAQIRDAAVASGFESSVALDAWLQRAVGENRKSLDAALHHVRRALSLCPLQGLAYLDLSELRFLDGGDLEPHQAYLEQALAVRPYDPHVLLAAGLEAWSSGDVARAIECWRGTFHRGRIHQLRLINTLADYVPARFFIDNFDPDWEALGRLARRYGREDRPEDSRLVWHSYAESSVARAQEHQGQQEAVKAWLAAQKAYDSLDKPDYALRALYAALAENPHSYQVRHGLGMWLYRHKRFAEAAEHLAWCSARRPRDQRLKSLAERTAKERLRGEPGQAAERGGPATPSQRF